MPITTLKMLYENHPEWHNIPMVIYRNDGNVDYIGAAGTVYAIDEVLGMLDGSGRIEPTGNKVLVFAPN